MCRYYNRMLNVNRNIGEKMKLVKFREYPFTLKRVNNLNLPTQWVRDNLKDGDTLGIYVDAETQALVIKKVDDRVN